MGPRLAGGIGHRSQAACRLGRACSRLPLTRMPRQALAAAHSSGESRGASAAWRSSHASRLRSSSLIRSPGHSRHRRGQRQVPREGVPPRSVRARESHAQEDYSPLRPSAARWQPPPLPLRFWPASASYSLSWVRGFRPASDFHSWVPTSPFRNLRRVGMWEPGPSGHDRDRLRPLRHRGRRVSPKPPERHRATLRSPEGKSRPG